MLNEKTIEHLKLKTIKENVFYRSRDDHRNRNDGTRCFRALSPKTLIQPNQMASYFMTHTNKYKPGNFVFRSITTTFWHKTETTLRLL